MTSYESFRIEDTGIQINRSDSVRVTVLVDTPRYTIVPSLYFSFHLQEPYLQIGLQTTPGEVMMNNHLPGIDYHLVFSINQKLKLSIDRKFPENEYFHYISAMVIRLLEAKHPESSCAFIHKQSSYFYLILRKNNSIVAVNSYDTANDYDIIYLTLNALHKNGIDPKYTSVLYSGKVKLNDPFINMFVKYVGNVKELHIT